MHEQRDRPGPTYCSADLSELVVVSRRKRIQIIEPCGRTECSADKPTLQWRFSTHQMGSKSTRVGTPRLSISTSSNSNSSSILSSTAHQRATYRHQRTWGPLSQIRATLPCPRLRLLRGNSVAGSCRRSSAVWSLQLSSGALLAAGLARRWRNVRGGQGFSFADLRKIANVVCGASLQPAKFPKANRLSKPDQYQRPSDSIVMP